MGSESKVNGQHFKETEIGEIPQEWEVVRLIDVAEYINGYGFSPKEWSNKGLPIIRIQNLNDRSAEFNYFDGEIDSKYLVENGDLLFSWSASIGVYIWNRGKAVLNQHIFKVVPNNDVDKTYLYYSLHLAIEQLKNKVHGSTMKHFKRDELKVTKLPLPPLPEQKRIAKVLATVDEAIEKTEREIEHTERLKKGLMQKLLTRGIGHTEFKETEIGRIPKEWEVVRLGDVSIKMLSGGTPSTSKPEYWNGDIPWMTSAHIDGREIWEGQKYITENGLKNSATNLIPKNNLLVATRVGIGKAAVNRIDIAISQDLTGVIIDKKKAIPEFLYWILISNPTKLKALAQGSTIKGILRNDLARLKLPLPLLPEQRQIAEILGDVDSRLELLRERKERLERVKKGLMNDLLTGRKRVPEGVM